MKKTIFWLAVIVGLQVAWIAGTAVKKEVQLRQGTCVLLETLPVDPRDFLRGDYVILHYKISDIPNVFLTNVVSKLQPGLPGSNIDQRKVYVVLEPHGQFHEAVSASFEPPTVAAGQLCVRGTVASDRWRWNTNTVRVKYEIEKYFVPEGTGNPRGKVTVKVAVAADGAAIIKEVFVDGKPYAEAIRSQMH